MTELEDKTNNEEQQMMPWPNTLARHTKQQRNKDNKDKKLKIYPRPREQVSDTT